MKDIKINNRNLDGNPTVEVTLNGLKPKKDLELRYSIGVSETKAKSLNEPEVSVSLFIESNVSTNDVEIPFTVGCKVRRLKNLVNVQISGDVLQTGHCGSLSNIFEVIVGMIIAETCQFNAKAKTGEGKVEFELIIENNIMTTEVIDHKEIKKLYDFVGADVLKDKFIWQSLDTLLVGMNDEKVRSNIPASLRASSLAKFIEYFLTSMQVEKDQIEQDIINIGTLVTELKKQIIFSNKDKQLTNQKFLELLLKDNYKNRVKKFKKAILDDQESET